MIKKQKFGNMPDGRQVDAYILKNISGASVKILNLGGIIAELNIPDRDGRLGDCICGFADVDGYLNGGGYQGALIGRYANRIGKGKFTLGGREYTIAKNDNGKNHLHGGDIGYNARLWDVQSIEGDPDLLVLTLKSPDGEEGYPGNLKLKVTYSFGSDGALGIHYEAVCDADTICNFTNHSYFNLDGYGGRDILTHKLHIASDEVTEVDAELIPTGKLLSVEGTKYDFRTEREIAGSYDDNFILNSDGTVKLAATLSYDGTGRKVDVYTDMPGIQIYDAVMMDGEVPFKGGVPQRKLHAVAMETQFWPDSPNHANFPSCELKAGDKYDRTTIYKFSTY